MTGSGGAGTRAWIALGSNLGDRRASLDAAVARLRAADGVDVLRVSRWIETDPVGGPPGQGRFLNGVLEARTRLEPRALLALLLSIEAALGRRREAGVRNGPRTLDLDLLLVEGQSADEADLTLPHPRLEERAFVLAPLAELAPDLLLPSGRTARAALARLVAQPVP